MWKDPIVEETRQLRDQYASHYSYDIEAIVENIQQRQEQSERKIVKFAPRKAIIPPSVA